MASPMTVTATAGGNTSNGIGLRLFVLTNAIFIPNGPQWIQSAAAAHNATAATTQSGSCVYGAVMNGAAAAPTPVDANTTLVNSAADSGHTKDYGAWKATSLTGTPGSINLGFSDSNNGGMAGYEILPSGGTLTEDASAPAFVSTTSASAISTASFTPPDGALLVACIAANGTTNGTVTMAVTDSTGGVLSWQVAAEAHASNMKYAGVFVAQLPAAAPPAWTLPSRPLRRPRSRSRYRRWQWGQSPASAPALAPYTVFVGSQASGSTTFVCTVGTGVAGAQGVGTGDAIVVSAQSNSAATAASGVTDSKGNTYVPGPADTTQSPNIVTFIALNATPLVAGTDTITVTYAGTATTKNVIIRGCAGIASSSAVDQSATADSASSANPSVATGTLAQPAEWAISALSDGTAGGTPSSWTGGFTAVNTQGAGPFLTVADQVTSGTAALTAGATIVSTTWTMAVVTLEAAAAGGVAATASGNLDISGTASAAAQVTASGSLSLSGTSAAAASASASGSISITGTGPPGEYIPAVSGLLSVSGSATAAGNATASGSLSISGTASAAGRATASGSISLSGTATAGANATASGSISLTGTAAWQIASVSGSLSITGTATAKAAATASGSISINGTAIGPGNNAAGSISIIGTASAVAPVTASGSLSIAGTASARAAVSASGSLSLSGSAVATARVIVVSAGLAITGSVSAVAKASASGALVITGTASAFVTVAIDALSATVSVDYLGALVSSDQISATVTVNVLSANISADSLSADVQTNELSAEVIGV